jgi:hypothetical protein
MLYLLDSNVWSNAVDDRREVDRLARAGYAISVPEAAVWEMVVAMEIAASKRDSRGFQRARRACGIAAAASNTPLTLAALHLASRIGLPVPDLDVLSILRTAAHVRSIERFRTPRPGKPSFSGWWSPLRSSREHWRSSIVAAFQDLLTGKRPTMTRDEYEAERSKDTTKGDRSIARIEAHEVVRSMHEVGAPTDLSVDEIADRLIPHLDVPLRIHHEVFWDQFDGPNRRQGEKRMNFDANDASDLEQLRYLQPTADVVWVTEERKWAVLARRAGLSGRILKIDDVAT